MAAVVTWHFFQPLGASVTGERFIATKHTVGLWYDDALHGAPPSALLVRAMERFEPRADMRLGRVVMDILGPIPLGELEVRARMVRPGRRIELIGAELWAIDGDSLRLVAQATGWRIANSDTSSVVRAVDESMKPRSAGRTGPLFYPSEHGYLETLDFRVVSEIGGQGPGEVWARPTAELVAGEELTAMQRLFSVADTANGIGIAVDFTAWTFLNTDLSVYVHREPVGEWIGVSAATSIGPEGVGMSSGVLHDEQGPIGRVVQVLQVAPR